MNDLKRAIEEAEVEECELLDQVFVRATRLSNGFAFVDYVVASDFEQVEEHRIEKALDKRQLGHLETLVNKGVVEI